jgi:SAM-dependent methyltransferase
MLKDLENKIIDRWENCCPEGAHLYPFDWHKSEKSMFKRYKQLVTDKININDCIIIDYGCGGGYLGRWLLENFNIKQYVAYDIAKRSIERAKEQLKNYENTYFKQVILNQIPNFYKKNPDIFISLACIIHFPTKNYLDKFLNKVNNCGAKFLVLEIRDKGIGLKFRENIYETFLDGNQACYSPENYISGKLDNYELTKKADKRPTKCEILYYRSKK